MSRAGLGFAALMLGTFAPNAALADALTAERAIEQAVAKVQAAEFEQALDLLRAAEGLTEDRRVLARIYREAGVVQEILKRPDDTIVSFYRAIRCDGAITLDPALHKASAVKLFTVARAFSTAELDLSGRPGPDRSICARPAAPPLVAAPPVVEPPSTLAPWIATGASAVAAGAGVVLALSASAKNDECSALIDAVAYARCDADATDRERNAALVLGAAGGAAIVAAALWIYAAVE